MPGRLWRNQDFLKLWAGQSVSLLGTEVTILALPTVAILTLHANPLEVGLLAAAQYLPFPLFSVFAGVWVDRLRRRPLMIAADFGRGVALATIPVAAINHVLSLGQVFGVAFILGTFTVVFDVAYLAYLPALVGPSELLEGNTKLQISDSVAGLSGPGLGGLLIQFLGAARAISADALSYAVSVFSLLLIRSAEPSIPPSTADRNMLAEIREGFALVFRNAVLRAILTANAVGGLGFHMAVPIVYLYAYRSLHLSPGVVGFVFVMQGVGSLLAALSNTWVVRRASLGKTLLATQALSGLMFVLVPLASLLPTIPTLVAVFTALGYVATVFNINQVSVRQFVTPNRLQGRMNASMRAIFWGVRPIAGPVGGLVATLLSPVATLLIGGTVGILSSAAIVFSPLIDLKEHATSGLDLNA